MCSNGQLFFCCERSINQQNTKLQRNPDKNILGAIELKTKGRKDFTITEKALTKAFPGLKKPNNRAFTFKIMLRHYCEIFAKFRLQL